MQTLNKANKKWHKGLYKININIKKEKTVESVKLSGYLFTTFNTFKQYILLLTAHEINNTPDPRYLPKFGYVFKKVTFNFLWFKKNL